MKTMRKCNDEIYQILAYIIDHNPSWKENQTKKREFLDP